MLNLQPAEANTTDKDQQILELTDDQYQPHTWDNLQHLIGNNELHLLTRYPSQLRKYLDWSAGIKEEYGSVTNFILKNRVQWEPSPPELCPPGFMFKPADPTPLKNPNDYRILINDWPYGLDKGINHLIVWQKHRLPSANEKGDIRADDRELVEAFVQTRFRDVFGSGKVLWFRNWTGIQSVKSLEHFHVLLLNPSDQQLEQCLH